MDESRHDKNHITNMDPSLCTQPPEISDLVMHESGIANAHDVGGLATSGADKKRRKSKLKSHRQATSVLEATSYEVSSDQVAAALAASRARVASQQLLLTSAAGVSSSDCAPKNAAVAADCANIVDLTASSPPRQSKQNVDQQHKDHPQSTKKQKTPKPAASASNAITPTPSQSKMSLVSTGDTPVKRSKSLPTAPEISTPTEDKEGRKEPKKLKLRDANVPRVSLDAVNRVTDDSSNKATPTDHEVAPTSVNITHKAARVSIDTMDKESPKVSQPTRTKIDHANAPSKANKSVAKDSNSNSSSKETNSPPPTKTTTKKKKRSFHDQILYTMLTSCRPYSLKSLAKACDTTPEALHHAMLSFIDKQLVICKEFPSKKGEPKKLYWANPMSMQEMNGKTAVCRELTKLFASADEIDHAQKLQRELQQRHRILMEELNPLLAIPTLQQLDEQMAQEEQQLKEVQSDIQAIRNRMELAAKPCPPTAITHRFKKLPPSKPLDKSTLKRKINHMLSEYKTRKRQCMDFVEQLADAMEKKVKDVTGEKVLALDTDEMEWGCWVDGATGKVNGVTKKSGGASAKEQEEKAAIRIPSKYMDV